MKDLINKLKSIYKENKKLFWILFALIVIAIGSIPLCTSCSSSSSFTMTADTLYMDNPNIHVKDTLNFSFPK